jgi:hypothetical protein
LAAERRERAAVVLAAAAFGTFLLFLATGAGGAERKRCQDPLIHLNWTLSRKRLLCIIEDVPVFVGNCSTVAGEGEKGRLVINS